MSLRHLKTRDTRHFTIATGRRPSTPSNGPGRRMRGTTECSASERQYSSKWPVILGYELAPQLFELSCLAARLKSIVQPTLGREYRIWASPFRIAFLWAVRRSATKPATWPSEDATF